ncbi:Putative collagen-binding domain of a collagenase [Tangfeifania diversioriginum]|uniref:Putative collagen-binding domain of a collagenase n=2 Tax=Tangfeifania diversioriginum TaxID=1168035 RepID=A0A1M6EPA9_9BACT|nr:Putative collagen-binding domain of a collagenase [Tangfeifania diversioriginum]
MKQPVSLLLLFLLPLFLKAQFIEVSKNNSYLETSDGEPFLWIGDTAWELFHRLNREDATMYLKNREEKGFSVIQAVVLAERDGLNKPNAYGEIPLIEKDPIQPNEKYFEHVDFIVNEAEKLGLVVGMLPTWGDKVTPAHGGGPVIFNEHNAFIFGEFLGNRYKNKPIVWILGGDRNVANEQEKLVWRAMANGLKKGDGENHLITYHPRGYSSSHEKLHHEDWLDFNTYQCGHSHHYMRVYDFAETLSNVEPRKPFLDAEPAYEDIPVEFWNYLDWSNSLPVPEDVLKDDHTIAKRAHFEQGFFDDHDVRVHAYWNFLAGACGYTYGNNAIWQMFEEGGDMAIPCLTDWRDALDRPGAESMRFVREIFEKRPFHLLVPNQSVILGNNPNDSLHVRAAVASDKSFMLVYAGVGQKLNIDLSEMQSGVIAWWYNPRNGKATKIGKIKNESSYQFVPPSSGKGNDWLLVLDNPKAKLKNLKLW